ncbi:hypothetical protein [uncultured Maribacter sp.]|uniref:hypothetical protein n=1 Tax=uncultured Maribacter sp. TaxID=431308 RepID=UPI002609A434|nr:hypothetical protein [uncultured Maribacter sp.]
MKINNIKVVFHYKEKSINKIASIRMLSVYPIIICTLIAAFIIANHIENNEFLKNKDLLYMFVLIGIFFLIAGFFSGKKSLIKILADTKFELFGSSIEKQIPNGKNIRIEFREILSFHKVTSGVLLKTKNKKLEIPNELEGFEILSKEIRSHIHAHVIHYKTNCIIPQVIINTTTSIGILLILTGLFIFETKEQKLLFGIPLFLFLVVAIIKILSDKKNKHRDYTTIYKAIFFTILLLIYLAYIFFY